MMSPELTGIVSGLIISIIAGGLTIITNLIIDNIKNARRITYEILSNIPLLDEEAKSQVQKAFNCPTQVILECATPLPRNTWENVQSICVKITNTGRRTINEADYVGKKIIFDFSAVPPNNAKSPNVLDATVLEADPPGLAAGIPPFTRTASVKTRYELPSFPLNPKSSVTLGILVANFNNIIKNNTLINGVKQIPKADVPSKLHIRNLLVTFGILTFVAAVLFLVTFTAIFESTYHNPISDASFYNAFLLCLLIGSVVTAIVAAITHIACNCAPSLEVINAHQELRMNEVKQPPSRTTMISTLCILPFVSGVFYFLTISLLFADINTFIYTPGHIDSSLLDALNNANLGGFVITIIAMIGISSASSWFLHRDSRFPLKIRATVNRG